MSNKRSVVITGVSTGIGYATAKVLLEKGFRVFGLVRKQGDAERLSRELGKDIVPLLADVTERASMLRAASITAEMLRKDTLAGLVNNAGISVGGPLLFLDEADLRRQLEVNLIGPFTAVQAFAPLLGSEPGRIGKPGRIVQMSSVSGKLAVQFTGAYSASKFALEGMSDSLRRELMLYGIDVIVVAPGAVSTPIWEKSSAEDWSRFESTDFGPSLKSFRKFSDAAGKRGLPPRAVGEVVYEALTAKKPKVRYAVVSQKFKNWTLPMLLPKRTLDGILAKEFGMTKP